MVINDTLIKIVDNRGKTPPTTTEGRFLLEINCIAGAKKYPDYAQVKKFVSEDTYNTWFRSGHPQKGDILIPTVGTLDAIAVMDRNDCCIAQNMIAFRTDPDICDSEYLYYYLCNPIVRKRLLNLDIGGVQPSIKVPHIKKLEIDIPKPKEQREIASVLSAIDDKIQLNYQINDNLEQQTRSIFQSWFIDYVPFGGSIPSDWVPATLGQIAVIKADSWSPMKNPNVVVEHYSIPAYDEKHYPVFERASGIKSNKYLLTPDSVMISKLNPETKRIWRPTCLSENPVCSTEFIVYEAKKREQRDYIYSLIDSVPFFKHLCSHTTGSTNSRQRATPKNTLDFSFHLPPDSVIENFCQIVTPMYDLIATNTVENQLLAKTRDSLLPGLMSGEIDVSDIAV